jgi:hypothetical protein
MVKTWIKTGGVPAQASKTDSRQGITRWGMGVTLRGSYAETNDFLVVLIFSKLISRLNVGKLGSDPDF